MPPSSATPPALPDLFDIEDAVRAEALGVGASELHGALCGWLAGGGRDSPAWLAAVLADDAVAAPAAGSALDRMRLASAAQLRAEDFDFHLLVPDDDATLAERSGALFDWCRGFLGGFGLAAGQSPPLSEDSREALEDLAKLAAATAQDEGDEDDEAALVEIEEFVRGVALMVHSDCVLGAAHRGKLH